MAQSSYCEIENCYLGERSQSIIDALTEAYFYYATIKNLGHLFEPELLEWEAYIQELEDELKSVLLDIDYVSKSGVKRVDNNNHLVLLSVQTQTQKGV